MNLYKIINIKQVLDNNKFELGMHQTDESNPEFIQKVMQFLFIDLEDNKKMKELLIKLIKAYALRNTEDYCILFKELNT